MQSRSFCWPSGSYEDCGSTGHRAEAEAASGNLECQSHLLGNELNLLCLTLMYSRVSVSFLFSVSRVSWYLSVYSQDSHSNLQVLILTKCFTLGILLKFLWSSSSSVGMFVVRLKSSSVYNVFIQVLKWLLENMTITF